MTTVPNGISTSQPIMLRVAATAGLLMPLGLITGFIVGFGGNLLSGTISDRTETVLAASGAALILTGVASAFVCALLVPFLRCAACNEKVLWTTKTPHPQPYSTYSFGGGVALGINVLRGRVFSCPHCGTMNHLPR